MPNTSITYPSATPEIDNAGIQGSTVDTEIAEPSGTMIQRKGVDVSDEFDSLNFQCQVEENPNYTIEIKGIGFKKNSTVLNTTEPATVNLITNKDAVYSGGVLTLTDEIIKKSSVAVMTGPKKYNFLGEALVIEDPENAGEVIVNLSGSGFFGDASDGDYTLDGNQTSVAGLFTYGGVTTPISIVSVVAAIDDNIVAAYDAEAGVPTNNGTIKLAYLKTATGISSFSTNALVRATAHGLSSNDSVLMTGFLAGIYEVIVINADYFILRDSTFAGTYTSGATVKKLETYTLLRDVFFDDLVLTNVRLVTANFRLFARTCTGTGRICNSGDVASVSGYFPTPAQGTSGGLGGIVNLPDPAAGGTQGDASSTITTSLFDNSSTPTKGSGGLGGNGEDYSAGGTHGGTGGDPRNPASTSRPTETFRGRFNLITGTCLAASSLFKFTGYSGSCGGSGGGAGAFRSITYLSGVGGDGGDGGSNGGIMLVCIRYFTGTIKIKSNGSVGTNGVSGTAGQMNPDQSTSPSGGGGAGGGGGSAGAIFLFYQFKSSTVTTEVRGGDGGLGGGRLNLTLSDTIISSSGDSGLPGNAGLVDEYQIT